MGLSYLALGRFRVTKGGRFSCYITLYFYPTRPPSAFSGQDKIG
jgi:hypothetical protein